MPLAVGVTRSSNSNTSPGASLMAMTFLGSRGRSVTTTCPPDGHGLTRCVAHGVCLVCGHRSRTCQERLEGARRFSARLPYGHAGMSCDWTETSGLDPWLKRASGNSLLPNRGTFHTSTRQLADVRRRRGRTPTGLRRVRLGGRCASVRTGSTCSPMESVKWRSRSCSWVISSHVMRAAAMPIQRRPVSQ